MSRVVSPQGLSLYPTFCLVPASSFAQSTPRLVFNRRFGRALHGRAEPPGYRSWGGEIPDWGEDSSDEDEDSVDVIDESDEDIIVLPEGYEAPEFFVQNALAAVLLGALVLAGGNLMFKLVLVGVALISAALRYSIIGILVICLLAFFS